MAGGRVPWWVWALLVRSVVAVPLARGLGGGPRPGVGGGAWWGGAVLVWSVGAVPLGLVLGALLRAAEWRQSGRGCDPGFGVPEEPEEAGGGTGALGSRPPPARPRA